MEHGDSTQKFLGMKRSFTLSVTNSAGRSADTIISPKDLLHPPHRNEQWSRLPEFFGKSYGKRISTGRTSRNIQWRQPIHKSEPGYS
jgi:hypothetical protein